MTASTRRVRKAVLPVAGLGTRVLPAAKTTPKNMLNVFDRPILSHIVEEARAAGIEHFIFIVGRGQESVEAYFDHAYEMEAILKAKGKDDILALVTADLPRPGEMSFVRQMAPLGLGHAVFCARDLIGDEPFAVILPDMLMMADTPALGQAIAAHEQTGGNIVVVEPAPEGETHKYGIVALEGQGRPPEPHDRHGRETAAGDRAVEPVHLGPLRPDARHLPASGRPADRRGR